MSTYRATAYNAEGLTFEFRFQNFNWNGVEDAAKVRLDAIVSDDALHRRNGPWNVRNIDRTA